MAEKKKPALITETKINGVIFVVQSSFRKNCTETAISKMAKALENELHELKSPSYNLSF